MPAHGFSTARHSDLSPDPRGQRTRFQHEFNPELIRPNTSITLGHCGGY